MGQAVSSREKDGRLWRLAEASDVSWIRDGTSAGRAITAAIPPVFVAYATLELPESPEREQDQHDAALLDVLKVHTGDQPWWLGYLDTGADDVVFDDAPRTDLYAGWGYVLVEAGPTEASTWRAGDDGTFWKGALPNLMFPADRSWLVSTLWDDGWTCVGGPAALVNDLLSSPELGPRARGVGLEDADSTPPGLEAR